MNKTLILARHGKAEKSDVDNFDFKRNLTERGESDVLKVAQQLSKIINPELIVSSPANRAYQTAKIFAKVFDIDKKEIDKIDSIYEASMRALLHVINNLDNTKNCILITGHNPAFEYAVEYLTAKYISELPTSGTAVIEFPIDHWNMVSQGLGDLKILLTT